MALVDAGIGDVALLRPKAETDALGDAGEHGGLRRADGAIENPYAAEMALPQPRDEQKLVETAAQLRAGIAEINRLGDARLRRQQLFGAARRRRQERHLAARRYGGDGSDKRQMPDDVADAPFDLDDRARRHIDCRVKGCDMALLGEAEATGH